MVIVRRIGWVDGDVLRVYWSDVTWCVGVMYWCVWLGLVGFCVSMSTSTRQLGRVVKALAC